MTTQPGEKSVVIDSDEIDLTQIGATIWSGKFWVGGFTVAALVLALLYLAVTPPSYQADTLVQLEERGSRLALPDAMRGLISEDVRTVTEMEIVHSRMILGQAVADLNLDWHAAPVMAPVIGYALTRHGFLLPDFGPWRRYARSDTAITLDLLEVPPAWIGAPMDLVMTDEGRYRLTTPDGAEHAGTVGEILRDEAAGFAIRVGQLTGRPGRAFTVMQQSEAKAIDSLRNALSVTERGRQSGVLDLRLTAQDRREAERRLNAITQAYVRQNVLRSAAEAENSLRFIEQQMPEAERAVAEAEQALNRYRQERQSIDLSFETQNLLTQISRIEGELRELQVREDEIDERYTRNHPVYQQLLTQRARLEEQLASLREEVGHLPETQRDVLNLTRNLELAQQIYLQMLSKAQELRVLQASTIGNVRIIDSAQAAIAPIAPKRSLILALSLLLGAMGGVGFVLLRDWMRKGVQGSQELEQAGLPVFATINYSPYADHIRTRRHGRLPILAITDPTDLVVEAFRSLRTSLHFGMLDASTRSLAITSSAPGAGKSFTSVNLAVVTAQAGQTVCLIDADMRRGQLRKYFDVAKNTPGLAEYLAGEVSLDEVLIEGPLPGLHFLPSGQFPPNPADLLMRKALPELVETLNTRFDLSIFDCTPVLAVTDPVVISRSVGASIAVVRFAATPIGEVHAMHKAYENAGLKLNGAILNGYDPQQAKGQYGYSYGYNYRYEYKQRQE